MKILQICNHFHPCVGGIERHVEELSLNLIMKGHECDVLCLNSCAISQRTLPFHETYMGIKIYRIPYLNFKIYKIAPTILRYVDNYDVLHVHGLGFFSDFLALTKVVHKKPLVLSTHGGIFHTSSYRLLKRLYFNLWCRSTLKWFDAVIAVSRSDERLFSRISEKMVFIPNAIAASSFKAAEGNNFIYFGRLSNNKRLDRIVRVFSLLSEKIGRGELFIVGEDWGIKGELRKLAESLGIKERAIFKNSVDRHELIDLLQRSGFFLSASEYEGFGISVLEAMASGLVVFVNDIPPFKEFVKDGENGFIVNYSDPDSASSKIAKVIGGDLSIVRRNARETASEYDWRTVIGKVEAIYKGLKN